MRNYLNTLAGALLGLLLGALIWALVLGIQVHRSEPGLWTVRPGRLIACGLDYNGPPWRQDGIVIWLTCGDSRGFRLWPLPSADSR